MNWRILNVDWYAEGMIEATARKIVRDFFGPMIPVPIYRMLEKKIFRTIIRGFTLVR